jgi:DNA uptake protein ComE-like DNA-binding protein
MRRNFQQFWKSYNDFSKSDRNAAIILSAVIMVSIIANIIVNNIEPKSKYNYSEYGQLLNDLGAKKSKDSDKRKSLFVFDPNTIIPEMLDSLDLPENIKRNILNYRKAGGRFNSSSQVRKIYGMNDSIFNLIEEYIIITESFNSASSNKIKPEKVIGSYYDQTKTGDKQQGETAENSPDVKHPISIHIELNSADSAGLVLLNGIGPAFANRILKYRGMLGGFYSTKQLLEVYNFPEETFRNIEGNISADTLKIKKIRLNFAEYGDFIRHPYFSKNQVEGILKFREKNGSFQSIHQVKSSGLIDDETFSRISPYLTCR